MEIRKTKTATYMFKYSTEVRVLEKTLDSLRWFLFVMSSNFKLQPWHIKTLPGNLWMALRWSDSDYLSELIWNASSVNAVSETKGFLQVVRFVSRLSKGFLLSLWSGTVHSYSQQLFRLIVFWDKKEASRWCIQEQLLFVLTDSAAWEVWSFFS